MKSIYKRARYSYWLTQGFLKKHLKIIVLVCIAVFILVFFSSALLDSLTVWFSLNKQTIGIANAESGLPQEVMNKISRPLIGFNKDGSFLPEIAEKITANKNGTEFLLQLRQNLKWQDGSDVTVASIPKKALKFPRVTTESINDRTVKFSIPNNPLAPFPALLSSPLTKENFVGIGGAYRLRSVHYKEGVAETVILAPQEAGKPVLQYKIYPSESDLLLGYKLGEISEFSSYDQSLVAPLRSWRNTNIQALPDVKKIATLFINTQKPPLDNRSIRQAIAQGIDYDGLGKYGVRAYTSIVPFSWAFNRDVKTFDFEPEIARGLLHQNTSKGTRLTLYTSYQLNTVAESLKKSLEQAGFAIDIRYTNYIPTTYDLYLTVLEPGIDPDQYIFWHSTQTANNFSKLRNLKVDNALEVGRREMSQENRKKAYQKVQEVISEEVPAVFLFHPNLYVVSRK